MLGELSWTLDDPFLQDAHIYVREIDQLVNSEKVNEYLNQPLSLSHVNGQVTVIYPISRYGEYPDFEVKYNVQDLPTVRHLIGAINTFYQYSVNDRQIKLFSSGENRTDLLDHYHRGERVTLVDVMAGLRFFEGLDEIAPGQYQLLLGS